MTTIQFRTDEATKNECGALFNRLGLSMTDAINIFLKQAVMHGGLPFEVKVPRYNATTLAALQDMEQSKTERIRGKNAKTVLAELKAN